MTSTTPSPQPDQRERIPFPPPYTIPVVSALILVLLAYYGYQAWNRRTIRILKDACLTAIDNEQWQQAEQIGLRWVEYEPENTQILVHLADAAKGQKAYDRTVQYLLQIPDTDPKALTLLNLAADLQFNELIQPFEAEKTWLRMLAIEPRANVPRRRLMFFYALSLQRAKLKNQIDLAIQTGSESPDTYIYLILLYKLNFTDAFVKLTSWLEKNPDHELLRVAQALALAGAPSNIDLRFYGDGKLKPGDRILIEQCLQDYPHNLELQAFQLNVAIDEGNVDHIGRLLQIAPPEAETDSRFWRARGWYLRARNQFEAAEQAYRKALEQYPFDWRAMHQLSQVLRRLKQEKQAEQLAHRALTGKKLETNILEIPDTSQVSTELLKRIRDYAQELGQTTVVNAIDFRIGRKVDNSDIKSEE